MSATCFTVPTFVGRCLKPLARYLNLGPVEHEAEGMVDHSAATFGSLD
jgi:hypothetical protein